MPVMVCMDGFILTHAVRAGGHARRRRRSTPSCRPTSRARCWTRRAGVHRRHGRPRGLHGSALPGARQADAWRWSASRRSRSRVPERFGRDSGGLVHPTLPRTPRPSSVAWARCWARSRTPSTRCALPATRSACWASQSFRPFPLAAVRRGAAGRAARGGAGEELLGRPRRRGVDRRAAGVVGPAPARPHRGRRAGRAGHHQGASLSRMLLEAVADRLPALTFLDLDWRIVERQLERERSHAPQRPDRREPAARHRHRRFQGELMHTSPSSSTRPAPSRSATGCWRPSSAACSPAPTAATR
jgi:pyruvate ferredoxin oxidoreductase alpha subunit